MVELMKLTRETIDILSAKITELYVSCGANRKETIRARLLLEETLIKYGSNFNS